jgi:hypothetical protein
MEFRAAVRHALPGRCRLGELGEMTNMRAAKGLVLLIGLAMLAVSHAAAAADIAVAPLEATARRAGLRVLASDHLVLATDRPARDGDGVEDLPRFFDEAFRGWCDHYGIDPASARDWQAFGCLVVDRERFRAAGLLPATIPEFTNGFCDRNRFWMMDQSNPDYRRHLLLHEGVHAFTLTIRGLDAPEWYTEGIAEFLATHRLEQGADGREHVVLAPLPLRPGDVEQLGRIETLRAARRPPALAEVMAAARKGHGDITAYAADWAAVAVLARHPAFARQFAAAERGPLDADFSARLASQPGWNQALATREYAFFTSEVDYGWDFARTAVDWSPGRPLVVPAQVTVDAARGWQNTGLSLAQGGRCRIAGGGRVRLGESRDQGAAVPIESEADGITLRWYRGHPAGRLLAAQWVEQADGRAGFVVLAAGAAAEITAAVDGPVYLTVNDAPGDRADNAGSYTVDLVPP